MTCDGANNKQIKRKKLISMGHAPSKHPKHFNSPKRKQELVTTNMDPCNRGCLQKKSPQQTPASSPKQRQPPPYIAPVRKPFRHQIRVQKSTTTHPNLTKTAPMNPHAMPPLMYHIYVYQK